MKLEDIQSFSMDKDQIKAFVFAHMGTTDEALETVSKLLGYDRTKVGLYSLIQLGGEPDDLPPDDRADAIRVGAEYYSLVDKVEKQNYFADKI